MIFYISFLLMLPLVVNTDNSCYVPMTGSSLFRTMDTHSRQCWTREEVALLYSRRALLALVPTQIPHNIPLILEFIQICLTTLRELIKTKVVYEQMLAAVADTFGGYLQTYGLPLMHEGYYEGYVSYDTAAEFHRLQESFKSILMTNGKGWTRPMEVRKHINKILPLKMPFTTSSKQCTLLFTDPSCKTSDESSGELTTSIIPIPILDDNKDPHSIAIPFKNRALYNLKSRGSYDILIKYYIEASRCIAQSQESGLEQSEFDKVLSNWLKTKVIPHLRDEDWYVGFSNVLRIEETIQHRSGMIVAGQPEEKEEESLFSELESETQMTKEAYIVIIIIFLGLLLFICFLYWTFLRNCILCGKIEAADTVDGEPSDSTSLLSQSDDYYSHPSDKGRFCKHSPNIKSNSDRSQARTVSEESRLTLSCGLGKGICLRHK